ncbi:hypothetical protein SCHIN_v1c06770 [Spiroplasma chinense]|uniref:Lipoprotein n=1 Tax=Spiroplasma chinense TaxID=216932 RepID=A0A5B9Y475_9MOLU|nr:lipoprotein [Spiroplasma chinense]QEH61874.1 hypothetical protein SCHIN_v1c06770 [Spiroplasma chinense]
MKKILGILASLSFVATTTGSLVVACGAVPVNNEWTGVNTLERVWNKSAVKTISMSTIVDEEEKIDEAKLKEEIGDLISLRLSMASQETFDNIRSDENSDAATKINYQFLFADRVLNSVDEIQTIFDNRSPGDDKYYSVNFSFKISQGDSTALDWATLPQYDFVLSNKGTIASNGQLNKNSEQIGEDNYFKVFLPYKVNDDSLTTFNLNDEYLKVTYDKTSGTSGLLYTNVINSFLSNLNNEDFVSTPSRVYSQINSKDFKMNWITLNANQAINRILSRVVNSTGSELENIGIKPEFDGLFDATKLEGSITIGGQRFTIKTPIVLISSNTDEGNTTEPENPGTPTDPEEPENPDEGTNG